MLRVNSNNILVVPPFECAWLSGENFLLEGCAGCISFEVKGENDVTAIFKSLPGSRRWQPLMRSVSEDGPLPVERNYTIILGSHRNTCLKVEKDGQTCCKANDLPDAKLSSSAFKTFWISYDSGVFTVGSGQPGSTAFFTWTDPAPIPNIEHVGLSAWDKHVAYRNIAMHPAVRQQPRPLLPGSAGSKEEGNVPPLVALCEKRIESNLGRDNVCEVLETAELLAPALQGLKAKALCYLAEHLEEFLEGDIRDFLTLPASCFRELLVHPSLGYPEGKILDAVLIWGQPEFRSVSDLDSVLPLVRFPLMSQEELQAVATHPLAATSQALCEFVTEALESQIENESAPKTPFLLERKRHFRALKGGDAAASARFQRRHPPACTDLMYVCDGDRNGVCRYIGTCYGTQEWVNPVLADRMQVRASSPTCRTTNPSALVSGNFLRENFAGPRMAPGGASATWWLLDLGPPHRLLCNYYTLRHNGCVGGFLRSWALQGSNDGETWTDLRRHICDAALNMPGQYASWPISGHAASVPYRMFRVLLTGPNAGPTNQNRICLSYIELYGYFSRTNGAEAAEKGPAQAA